MSRRIAPLSDLGRFQWAASMRSRDQQSDPPKVVPCSDHHGDPVGATLPS